ncbi:MAG: small ribosomal subunit Rsm22 family protein [Acidobacteriia bacterium]|nr:small ribosomal subunit Rsm22 family protein [Terriglobia bacterium]
MPAEVLRNIEERAAAVGFPALKRAAAELSAAYRAGRALHAGSPANVAAYLVTRMPATYAAAYAALRGVRERVGAVASVLDIGAGTGGASLAARQWFPDAAITMIERDPDRVAAARAWLPDAAVTVADVTRMDALPPHDLVMAAYSLGELGRFPAARLWQAARVALVAIEPGTPRGFALIRGLRQELLDAGARMVAPCPAETACPMAQPGWCHFAARVERSSLHRRIKDAELGYEDEKFSYVALARAPVELPAGRIIRHPQHRPGLIVIETCTPAGLRLERISRRERERFRAARKAAWGDAVIS